MEEFYYPSKGEGKIHACRWIPEGPIRAVLQIVHGVAEYVERYAPFAEFLNERGIAVVGEDHMGHGKSIGDEGTQGYFAGGWDAAVADTHTLYETTREQFPKIPYFGKNGNFGYFGGFGKMGYFSHFAEIGEKWKNGCFCVFWKNGGSVENDILTDIGKTVKNGDFLTVCHRVENGDIWRSRILSTG